MLTVTLASEKLDSEDERFWRALNLRESLVQAHSSMTRTVVQRIFEMMAFIKRREAISGRLSPPRIVELYKANAHLASTTEAVTVGFIDAAVTVWNRCLADEAVRSMVLDVEKTLHTKTPFDSVYKLEAIVKKGGTEAGVKWIIASIADAILDGKITSAEFSLKALSGKGVAGGKGYCDLALYKREIADYLPKWAHSVKLSSATRDLLQAMLESHGEYRRLFGFSGTEKDLTFFMCLPVSGQLAVRLAEAGRILNPVLMSASLQLSFLLVRPKPGRPSCTVWSTTSP